MGCAIEGLPLPLPLAFAVIIDAMHGTTAALEAYTPGARSLAQGIPIPSDFAEDWRLDATATAHRAATKMWARLGRAGDPKHALTQMLLKLDADYAEMMDEGADPARRGGARPRAAVSQW